MTVPNIISIFRLLCAPILLILAWLDKETTFLTLLVITFISDALDGFIARHFNASSELGAKLDSWADVLIYIVLSISACWLWPNLILAELPYYMLIVISIIVPATAGLLKFGTTTSYHTWSVKIAAVLTATSCLLLFIENLAWPFRIASLFCLLAAIEQITLTIILTKPEADVKTLWHVMHQKN